MVANLGFIHTVSALAPTFSALAAELLPQTTTTTIADELLLKSTLRDGRLTKETEERLADHVQSLTRFGVDAVLVTCSSVGAVVDRLAAGSDVPLLRVDRPMAERAVELGPRVGVVATLRTTLEPTAELIARTAAQAGTTAEVVAALCDGAFDALGRGDTRRHDELVEGALTEVGRDVDVIVLAQASMARVADGLDGIGVPVLSSPRLAMGGLAGGIKDWRPPIRPEGTRA